MIEKGGYRRRLFGTIFDQNDKNSIQTIISKRSPQNIEFDAKWGPNMEPNRCPNPSKINAKTANEKDQENHQNHVSLNGKKIEIHWKNNCFLWFRRLCERERYQTNIKNETNIHPKIDTKIMLEQVMQKI